VFAGGETVESALLVTPIPLIGIALGIVALRRVRSNPQLYSGRGAAQMGLALSTFFLFGGLGYAGFVHATEVPDGYAPTSFADFKPDDADIRAREVIPPEVAALEGKKVFIKGYFRPDSAKFTQNVKQFLLVRDNNQCCFGDMNLVQFFDQVQVRMMRDLTVDYSSGLFRMGGVLHIEPRNAALGSARPVYSLDADYAQ
jgi:hypothetical protein